MTNTAKKLTILSANLNFYMSNKVQKKTSENIRKDRKNVIVRGTKPQTNFYSIAGGG